MISRLAESAQKDIIRGFPVVAINGPRQSGKTTLAKAAFADKKPDGTLRKLLDVSKLHSPGWRARTSREEGIRKTYEWFLSNRCRGL